VKTITIVLLLSSISFIAQSQSKLGNFYITWGYQRNDYSKSDIHFRDRKTDDYNFTLENAKAVDKPDMDDLFHSPLTVPQYVLNIGYFFPKNLKWGIEFSWDHLKYVVYDNQMLHVHGEIRGVPIDTIMTITKDFVHFEHTNGNNYAMISVVRRIPLHIGHWNRLSTLLKAGAGGLVPKTDSYVLGNHNDGPFRLSGFVIGASVNLRYDIYKYFFFEGSVKGAFADYTNSKVYEDGRARHHFFSVQYIWSAGINIPFQQRLTVSD
jgi:hypothetical protein